MGFRFKVIAFSITLLAGVMILDSQAAATKGLKFPWATATQLGGTERYLTHLSTDKPIYREGETVYLRAVVLHALSRRPLASGHTSATLQILGPKGEPIMNSHVNAADSVLAVGWPIPQGAAGGEYRAKLTFSQTGAPPTERTFEVRAYRPPRLNSQIVFLRDGYGPGDRVTASVHISRAEGGVPAGANVTVTALVDGSEVHRSTTALDGFGNASASFLLPQKISQGDGTLGFIVEDGGVVETASKTIPILLDNMDVAFFPEGGELVAGLANRLYVQVRSPTGKPADIEGVVVDDAGKKITTLRTTHEGRGHIVFTPLEDRRYSLEITKPTGSNRRRALPLIGKKGALLSTMDDVTGAGNPLRLRLAAQGHRRVQLVVAQKERLLAQTLVPVSKQPNELHIALPNDVAGVLSATLFSEKGEPLAERLFFRAPQNPIEIQVEANPPKATPGSEIELTVRTTINGQPHPAIVAITVTDESVLEMKDKREQAPRLPVMAYFENEVKDLADAHVYLDAQNPKAKTAIDLLLGTQGWRRFALVDASAFLSQHGDAGRRALAHVLPPPPPTPTRHRSRAHGPMPVDSAPVADVAVRQNHRKVGVPARPQPAPLAPAKKMPAPRPVQGRAPAAKDMALGARVDWRSKADAEEWHSQPIGMVWVREFAFAPRANRQPGERVDFSETLYWSAGVRTDEQGVAKVRFALSDSVSRFQAMADAFDSDGNLGSGSTSMISVEPFYLEAKMPLHATAGDVIELPISVVNSTAAALRHGTLSVQAPAGISVLSPKGPLSFGPNTRDRHVARLTVEQAVGPAEVVVAAGAGNYSDQVTRAFAVEPLGFPAEIHAGGLLDANGSVKVQLDIPKSAIADSFSAEIAVYPAPLGNLTASLQALMREPHGCFEQTSSTNYPLVMAQQYFTTHSGVDPQLIAQSQKLLNKGYERLRGFECKQTGYEWFGQDPGHEALSAYGLMQFMDMAKVMQVDMQMVERTRNFLLGKRDGKGGFTHERRALHTWLVEPNLHNGYITWALTEAGVKGIEREVASFKKAALLSPDSYVMALGANIALNDNDAKSANTLMQRLTAKQTRAGWVDGSSTSIVGSRGDALKIETTALATLAWLRDKQFTQSTESAIKYLAESAKGGRYGSTQSTVLALRAILAYNRLNAASRKGGTVQLLLNGQAQGRAVSFTPESQTAVMLPDLSQKLAPGQSTVTLQLKGGQSLPYSITVRYHARTPSSSNECKLSLDTTLRASRIDEGATTQVDVTVANRSTEVLPMPVAIVGIPGGLEVRHEQLNELKKAGRIAAYEVRGRDVVLYWRELSPKQTVRLPLSVVAAIPGSYTGPASRVYQYYVDEHRQWKTGMQVRILPK